MSIRLSLLGPPVVEVDGLPMVVDTRKAVATVAYLACTQSPVPRETLSFLLWPDYPPDRARAALRRTLSALRKGLGGVALDTNRLTAHLVGDDQTVVDVAAFEAALTDIDRSGLATLEEAVNLYRGDFMAGFAVRNSAEFDDWQQRQAAHYRRLAEAAMDRLAVLQAEAGRFGDAVATASRRLELDELHEPAHRRLMMLHASLGNRPAAVVQYQECVRILDHELGVAPLDETTDLYKRILAGTIKSVAIEPVEIKTPVRERTGFVGRTAELASLAKARRESESSIRLASVVGPAGFGKSRLIEEFLGTLGPEVGIVRTGCYEGEGSIPHSVPIGLLRNLLEIGPDALHGVPTGALVEAARLVPEVRSIYPEMHGAPPLDSPGGYLRLIDGVVEVILSAVCRDGPGVVVVDDAHWADADSLQILGRMIRHHADRPVLLLLAWRSTEVGAAHALAVIQREAERGGIGSPLYLERLTRAEVRELVAVSSPGDETLVGEVYRLSDGVALFAVEYLAMIRDGVGVDELPAAVRDLVDGLLARRSELAHQLLEAAAVIGRPFLLQTLRGVSGRGEEETIGGIEELLAAGLFRESTTEGLDLDFDHDRVRAHVYQSTSMLRRRLLHGRAADALALSTDPIGSAAAALAGHLAAAGRETEAAEQYMAAGAEAAELFANEQALGHYDAALALGCSDPVAVKAAVGDLLALRGDYSGSLANLNAAALEASGAERASLLHRAGVVHTRTGDWALAERSFTEAISLLAADDTSIARVLTDHAWLEHRRGKPRKALELAREGLQRASDGGDPASVAQAHNILGVIQRNTDPGVALEHHQRSLELVGDHDIRVRAGALNNLALTWLSSGDPQRGIARAKEALELVQRIGDVHKTAAIHSNLADVYRAAGQDEESRRHLRLSAELFAGVEPTAPLQPEIWKLTDW